MSSTRGVTTRWVCDGGSLSFITPDGSARRLLTFPRSSRPNYPTGSPGANPDPVVDPEWHRPMAASVFVFFRGSTVVMAPELGQEAHSGLQVQLCGDAHLQNFGF